MQVSDCERIGGKGLFSLKFVPKGDIVFILTGPIKHTPCKYSIEIGENRNNFLVVFKDQGPGFKEKNIQNFK